MGRYYFNKKDTVEGTSKLDINWLNKEFNFEKDTYYSPRTITWTRSGMWGESKSSITIGINLTVEGQKIDFNYTITRRETEEKVPISYSASLTKTKCNLGGYRYWFICPGLNCGRRVGCLYFGNTYFVCRHCLNLTYESRNDHKRLRDLWRIFSREDRQEKLAKRLWGKHGRRYYKGMPTKTYEKYLSLD